MGVVHVVVAGEQNAARFALISLMMLGPEMSTPHEG